LVQEEWQEITSADYLMEVLPLIRPILVLESAPFPQILEAIEWIERYF